MIIKRERESGDGVVIKSWLHTRLWGYYKKNSDALDLLFLFISSLLVFTFFAQIFFNSQKNQRVDVLHYLYLLCTQHLVFHVVWAHESQSLEFDGCKFAYAFMKICTQKKEESRESLWKRVNNESTKNHMIEARRVKNYRWRIYWNETERRAKKNSRTNHKKLWGKMSICHQKISFCT